MPASSLAIEPGLPCDPQAAKNECEKDQDGFSYSCQRVKTQFLCERDIFGTVDPPPVLNPFLKKDSTGSGAISDFLSRLIVLIYSIAGIVLLFMILWGALEWMLSGGDKEKIASARGRIFNAIIGIILFAIAFAIIRVIGQFTGFTFFKGQNDVVIVSTGYDSTSQSSYVLCSNGRKLFTPRKDNAVCTE
ncbi:MAG: hypothetical protein UT54_C0013G0007 [Candidatus Daviesbacteria bacterium GW2011_GWB1_39_5]|uniref:Uncharacterized protein n=1 Tax=Candidatus Daviesbacteria bacterium GW2011_GWC2_40_12 TaxID=1618431 RepID=A0A0G0QN85_9BACT|nr:MAG: hypothetical protein UT45_C0007G0014 [Candidatus Daviesbacteria bacterium GW2011_GWA2_39_33]KKR24723.1 MAG: hypothetical protein UT54_C0013G0007 [Candidatus Daviesbacteria bacterium GW2011_GWB1_39_5]KKR41583.1 MAG: hypothetical protein UT77_C0009G0041 [Candidatus Daviesbacteria bacterium GW2011_GWC2_40_12]